MSAEPMEPMQTSFATWIKRYIVNIPVALLMLAMALRLNQGVDSAVSTVAYIGRRFDISPEVAIVIMAIFGLGALFAPSRWHLLGATAPLVAYAVATIMHWLVAGSRIVPDVDVIVQIGLAVFIALWVMYGRPFPDEQLIALPKQALEPSSAAVDESEAVGGSD